ncbi:DUF2127 domain-containing protein [Patescibacteria group bacterium]|nr:DUF2127 domain-containing protein [Patescibacteria group bacterium]
MRAKKLEQKIEQEFHVSWYIVAYKLIFGLAELLTGIGIVFFGSQIFRLYTRLVSQELSEDPHDLLARLSERIVPHLFTHHTYLVMYLILLGTVKIAGAIGLMYKKNWGVDLLVGLSIILLPFQLASFFSHPNVFDAGYAVLGIFIIFYLTEFRPHAWISRLLLYRRAKK